MPAYLATSSWDGSAGKGHTPAFKKWITRNSPIPTTTKATRRGWSFTASIASASPELPTRRMRPRSLRRCTTGRPGVRCRPSRFDVERGRGPGYRSIGSGFGQHDVPAVDARAEVGERKRKPARRARGQRQRAGPGGPGKLGRPWRVATIVEPDVAVRSLPDEVAVAPTGTVRIAELHGEMESVTAMVGRAVGRDRGGRRRARRQAFQ